MKIEKKRLYLDDVRTPNATDWIIARNYDEFVAAIKLYNLGNFVGSGVKNEFFYI